MEEGRAETSFCIRSMNIRAIWWRRFRKEKKESSGGDPAPDGFERILRCGGLFRKKEKTRNSRSEPVGKRGEIGIVGESGCGNRRSARRSWDFGNYTGEVKVRDGVRRRWYFRIGGIAQPGADDRMDSGRTAAPYRHQGPRRRRQLVKEMLENVGLDESFAARHPRELSGGQKTAHQHRRALLMDRAW